MQGQWIGRYVGTNSGLIVLNLEDVGTHYEGFACVHDDNLELPKTFAPIRTTDKSEGFFLPEVPLFPIDPNSMEPDLWERVSGNYKDGITFPQTANIRFQPENNRAEVSWNTSIGTHGQGTLFGSEAHTPSAIEPLPVRSWDEFKRYFLSSQPQYRFIFRGQENNRWRLRTHFHRTGRTDLRRFMRRDISILHQHSSALTRHIYDLERPIENAAFFSLVQHHGFPTPLLDWTYSPFVAAYFAFRHIRPSANTEGRSVRIHVFNKETWCEDFQQVRKIDPAPLHLSVLEPLAIDNQRMLPQQALSTVTNIDDLESYIQGTEHKTNRQYLQVIDIPASERGLAIQDLSIMGITAAALFPGLDGLCEHMKERFFQS